MYGNTLKGKHGSSRPELKSVQKTYILVEIGPAYKKACNWLGDCLDMELEFPQGSSSAKN